MKALLIVALLAGGASGAGAWWVQGLRADAEIARIEAEYTAKALAMAEAVKEIGIRANEAIANADAKGIKEIDHAKSKTDALRKCIADGSCSMYLKSAKAPANIELSSDGSAGSLGNAASGISSETAGRILNLWEAVDRDAAKISYLQTYAGACHRAGVEANRVKLE